MTRSTLTFTPLNREAAFPGPQNQNFLSRIQTGWQAIVSLTFGESVKGSEVSPEYVAGYRVTKSSLVSY